MHKSRWAMLITLITLLVLTSIAPYQVSANQSLQYLQADKHILTNGLTVMVKERPSGGQVIAQLWVKTGAYNDTAQLAGLSHFLEHMVINRGTANWAPGDLPRGVDRIGGEQNGGTHYDYTCYYIQAEARHLELLLDMLADICFRPTLAQDQIDEERSVIAEEIRLYRDRAWPQLNRRLRSLVYPDTNYIWDVLGTEETVGRINREEFIAYLQAYYAPNNMVLVVAGDVESASVLELAEAKYGEFPPREVKAFDTARVFVPAKPIVVIEESKQVPSGQAIASMSFPLPVLNPQDAAAMDLLAEAYGGSQYSILTQGTSSSSVVTDIECSYEYLRFGGRFMIDAWGTSNKAKSMEKSLKKSLKRLHNQVDKFEFEKARQRLLTKTAFSVETLPSLAQSIGFAESVVGTDYYLEYLQALQRLTAADVKNAAKKYINQKGYILVVHHNPGR